MHWCFVESASSRHFRLCIASAFFPCDCMVQHIAFLPLGASVQGCSVWDQRHFNRVITRAFIKRQLHLSGMRPKGKGKHHRLGNMGKGKARGSSRDDTNLSNTESRGETMNPEQDPVNIESENEASPISEAEITIMPTPGHAHSCIMQASSSVVQSGLFESTFHRLLFHICGESSLADLTLCFVGA